MSTELVNGHASVQTGSSIKTQKRKYTGEDGEHTKKKKKRQEMPVHDAEPEHAEEAVEVKKKKKKKKSKLDAVVDDISKETETTTDHADIDIPDAPRIGMEEEAIALDKAAAVDEASIWEKKKKKKKPKPMAAVDDPSKSTDFATKQGDVAPPGAPETVGEEAVAVVDETPIKKKRQGKKKSRVTEDLDMMGAGQDDVEGLHTAHAILEPLSGQSEEEAVQPCRHFDVDHVDNVSHSFPIATTTHNSPFHLVRLSLYVPLPPISLSSALKSLCSLHLTPLLLTFYGPANGVIISFADPVLSAVPNAEANKPLRPAPDSTRFSTSAGNDALAKCADEAGVSWVWLTANFLVLRAERGMELEGWMNVCSEGFIGLVVLNYWQVGIGRDRIPKDWTWTAAGGEQPGAKSKRKKAKKAKLRDEDTMDLDDSRSPAPVETQETVVNHDHGHDADGTGYWSRADGSRVKDVLTFRIVDSEVVPRDRDKWALQIEGTLLDAEEERKLVEEERVKYEKIQARRTKRATAATNREAAAGEHEEAMMRGRSLRASREASVLSGMSSVAGPSSQR